MPSKDTRPDTGKLDRIVAEARRNAQLRAQGYRERALKIHPWICARCGREFVSKDLHALTVHHKDHNHDNNPPDGSNWELLCVYCHDSEHGRYVDAVESGAAIPPHEQESPATYKPFADLKHLLTRKA